MKVIHYIPSIDRKWGGTTSYIQLLSKELGKLVELHIVSHNSLTPVTLENVSIHYIESSLWKLKLIKKQWIALLNEIRPDIVHINCCWMPICAFTQKWAQQQGYKVIMTPHGMLEPWIIQRHYWTRKYPALLLYQKNAIKSVDYLHATAESEKRNLLSLGYNNKIQVISNGINVDGIQMKTTWEKNKQILFLSRIHVKKGIEFLLEAIACLKDELEGYVVNIAGEGDKAYLEILKSKVRNLGIEKLVNFCGAVYGEDKWDLYRKSDLFILPTYSENFGLVVAEALASGTPVITTQGTPWEDLVTYHCGWWTKIGVSYLVEAIREYLHMNVDELKDMGLSGRRLIEEKYSASEMAHKMKCMYETIK